MSSQDLEGCGLVWVLGLGFKGLGLIMVKVLSGRLEVVALKALSFSKTRI